jgi:hypothetical protein
MKRWFLFGVTGLTFMAVGYRTAFAQEDEEDGDGGCGFHSTIMCTGNGYHVVPAIGSGVNHAHTSTCKYCYPDGDWQDCHGPCTGRLLLAVNPVVRSSYLQALDAAREGDVDRLLAVGSGAPGFVVFNASRGSVQIVSCTGRNILASLRVTDRRALQKAATLPDAEVSMRWLAQLRVLANLPDAAQQQSPLPRSSITSAATRIAGFE